MKRRRKHRGTTAANSRERIKRLKTKSKVATAAVEIPSKWDTIILILLYFMNYNGCG